MDCYLCEWYAVTLAFPLFIVNCIRNRGINIWLQMWLQVRVRLSPNLIWYLLVRYWPFLWCNSIDECMATVTWEWLWILTIFMSYLLTELFIWLSTVTMLNSTLAFLSGTDDVHFGLPMESICEEFHLLLLQGITVRLWKAKLYDCESMRSWRKDKYLDLLIESFMSLME